MNTKIISGFPGVGKSFVFLNQDKLGITVLDSDSSGYSSDDNFPDNYIKHIKSKLGSVDIIFVSSHESVQMALEKNNMPYTIVYPNKSNKDEWVQRFVQRGNSASFIKFISDNWDSFIDFISNNNYPNKIELQRNEFVSDYLTDITKRRNL